MHAGIDIVLEWKPLNNRGNVSFLLVILYYLFDDYADIKAIQMRKTKAIYSELAVARKSSTITCLWQKLRVCRGGGKLCGRNKGSFSCALMGGCWPGEAVSELTRS